MYELPWDSVGFMPFFLHNSTIVMNLVATHSNCTSPMDYISHHALHSHIPIHHYTHHTAVTIHSLVLIVSPHLHLIHSHTFKQHSHMHSLRSLVFPWLTFPSVFHSLSFRVLPGLLTLSPDRLLPALLTPPAYWLSSLSAACPDPLLCLCLWICLIYVALDTTVWYLPVWPPLCINKAADGSQRHWPVFTTIKYLDHICHHNQEFKDELQQHISASISTLSLSIHPLFLSHSQLI